MPNQANFRSDITNQTDTRFLASRVVRVPAEEILLQEIPASFGYDYEDNVEFHFYTTRSNQLVSSIVTNISDQIVKLHIVSYDDGTYKTYLQVDFTKLFTSKNRTLYPGEYKVVINFFSDEIGSYNDRVLSVTQISPSRTEIEVAFNNNVNDLAVSRENDRLLSEFILQSFTKPDAVGVMKKLLKDGVDSEGLTANNILKNIEIEGIQSVDTTTDRLRNMGLDQQMVDAINAYLPKLFEKIREKIVIGDERVQATELMGFFREELKKTFQELEVSVDRRIKLY